MQATDQLPRPTEQYLRNAEWIYGRIDELARQHPNQWVAVHDGRVIAAGPALGAVTDDAERGAPRHDIAYHFVNDGTLIY